MPLYNKFFPLIILVLFSACNSEKGSIGSLSAQKVSSEFCKINSDKTSVGNPMGINLPSKAEDLYTGKVPTYFELNGVNVNMGNQRHFKEMKKLPTVFSHARTFHFMNKDYWDDGVGQANGNKPETLRKHDPKDIKRLKLLVDVNGVPLVRNHWQEGDKLIYFDPEFEVLMEEKLKEGFYNVYENYMNQNWIYQKSVSEQFNGHLQMTLTTVNSNFPKDIQAAYNFPNQWFKGSDWGDARLSAKAYAMLFARAYAPKDGAYKICEVLEIGNEPWGLKAETYQGIIDGFTEGFQSYYGDDFKIKLIPAAFQGNHLENEVAANWERPNWKDYFGTRLNTKNRCLLDGVNIHNYPNDLNDRAFNGWFKERLIATPESKSSAFLYGRNAWEWVNKNMPPHARNIYASEYGWDTRNDCKEKVNATAVGEAAQGVYVSRALLMMSRMGVVKANVFELLDDEGQNPCQFAYHSSGFYTLKGGKAEAKSSVNILQGFIETFGNLRFKEALQESEDFFVYELTDGNKNYLVGWLPTNVNNKSLDEIQKISKKVKFKNKEYTLSPIPKLLD